MTNLPNIKCSNTAHHTFWCDHSTDSSKVLTETIAFEQLFQHYFIVNYKNKIIDLVISNNSN